MPWHKLRPNRDDALAIAALTLFVAIFFWPVLTRQAWLPHGGGDLASFLYPMYRFAAQSLRSGQIPLWNPHLYAGAPFIADNQSGLFYPPNLLLFLLNPRFSYDALELLVIGHIWWAGVGMYVCVRCLWQKRPFSPLPALFAATAFMFSDLFITHIGNLNLIAVAAWLPLVFLLFHQAIHANQWRIGWAMGSGVLLGIATLAGHGQMTFLLAALLGSYALYATLFEHRTAALPLLLVTGLTAVSLSALSLFPALAGVRYTVRGSFGEASNYSLSLNGLIGLLAPNFYGRGAVRFWGNWPRVEAGYVGVTTLLLALVGSTGWLRAKRWHKPLFFLLTAIVFMLLALGDNAPLYPLLLRLLPNFPFQVPARFVLLADFALALLAAYGLQWLYEQDWGARAKWLWLGVAVVTTTTAVYPLWQLHLTLEAQRQPQMRGAVWLLAGLMAGGWLLINGRLHHKISAGKTAVLLTLLLATDLIGLGRSVEIDPNNPVLGFAADSPALQFLQADPGLHRLDIATGAWQPSLPQISSLYSIRGVFNPLDLANYSAYINAVGYRGAPLYNLLGVKYVVGGKNTPPGDTTFIIPVFDADPNVIVYLNTRALPRALVLHNAITVGSDEEAFDLIHRDDFDPAQTVVVKNGQPLSQTPTPAPIEILQYDLNQSRFRVTTDQPAYFLLSDIYHPDWRASVDGQETEIFAADYALRAVYLEPGSHEIRFWFSPVSWQIGLALTAVSWLILLLYGWRKMVARMTRIKSDVHG
ncbi:MAG: YfhO family protein [Anaerolineales bacterium]|nr:YfhO family protein [Anaerolineales bacterium]